MIAFLRHYKTPITNTQLTEQEIKEKKSVGTQ